MSTEGSAIIEGLINHRGRIFVRYELEPASLADETLIAPKTLQSVGEIGAAHHGIGHHTEIARSYPLSHAQTEKRITSELLSRPPYPHRLAQREKAKAVMNSARSHLSHLEEPIWANSDSLGCLDNSPNPMK